MKASHLTSPPPGNERTLLVGLETADNNRWDHEESLQELGEVVKSAGGEVIETAIQRRTSPTAAYYIGPGKANELAQLCAQKNMGTVIFNDELSPAQSRNLEKVFERKILDRTQLILDIFAQRAKSKDGKLQIELAQLQYLLPRLTGMWTHLSRQSGGIGTRGPGETQLEVDRRRVTERIARLSRELDDVRQQRGVQRQGRLRQHWPIVSLVGYTNAGKSTLLNRMTNAEVYAADKLFATLDPTTRQFVLPNKQKLLLTDTVGFLKQLPHHLIESFKATLEETAEADLLLHVVDLSHPLFEQQMAAVQTVLEELNAWGKQMIVVFNKVDRVTNPALVDHVLAKHGHSVAISAQTGEGMDQLFSEIEHQVKAWRMKVKLRLPNHLTALVAELHRVGRVLDMSYQGDTIVLTAHVPPQLQGKIRPYIVADDEGDTHARLPPADCPRERLLNQGAEALRTAELVAILLRTGTAGRPVLELSEFLLTHFGSLLEALSRAPVGELARVKGVGQAKAIGLKAAFALAARLSRTEAEARAIDSAQDVARLLGEEMRLLNYESVRVICLNTKHRVLAVEEISRGTLNESLFHPREAFRPALARQAHAVIFVHNHPSGHAQPSDADMTVTRRMREAGELLQIEVLDHVILGAPRDGDERNFFSFKDEGLL